MGLENRDTFESETIEGTLFISTYDLDGSVLAVEIVDEWGNRFLVADNYRGEALVKSPGKRISAHGKVQRDRYGNLIEVEYFEVL